MATSFLDLADAVANYYGSGSDQWLQIAQYGINSPESVEILRQVPGVNITVSNSGKILGWDYNNAFGASLPPAATIDSNVQSGTYGAGSFTSNIPGSAIAPSTDLPNGGMSSGAITTSGGTVLATVADRLSLATAGVALGTKLGKLIDSTIYSLNPEWFDDNFPTINPETWDDMATTQGGKQFIRAIFGLQNDEATMYLDERLLAQTYMMLLAQGAYSGSMELNYSDVDMSVLQYPSFVRGPFYPSTDAVEVIQLSGGVPFWHRKSTPPQGSYFYRVQNTNTNQGNIMIVSQEPGTISVIEGIYGSESTSTKVLQPFSRLGITYYGLRAVETIPANYDFVAPPISNGYGEFPDIWDLAYITFNGNIITAGIDGIQDNPQATTYINPSQITGTDLDTVLQQLKTLYPDLFNGSIYTDVPQNDGTTERYTYIPVPYPNTSNPTQPTSDNTPNINPQTDPQVNPNSRPESAQDIATQLVTPTPNSPDTGDGNTPPLVIPTGSANALYSIYNPTQGELNSFGAWLWSSNFVDQLLKLFNDPMQAIIGLHKVFAAPVISGTSTIKVGYLDSGVSSNVVGNQYVTIDCGSVNVSEYFGNVFDYDPFTQIYIYLPFVGIEKLDTGDVMRGVIGVKYHVDVLTGACLAEISVTRDGAGGILYTFAGNCAVQYPISSGSYMGIVASLASIAGGVVGTIASGGALAPVAMGAVNGVMNARTRVNHSGAFSGNAGAMGVKIPYLIITRPQACLADNFPAFNGYPANKTTSLSACSGFVKCETCHIENVPATDAELSEIEMLLKGGIII